MTRKLSEKTIRDISERISILDVVSPCVSLTKAGKYHKGLCPFHPDKNPSFVVNPERNTYHCFACATGGDVFSFFMKFHNVPFIKAVEELARKAGVPLETRREEKDPRKDEAFSRAVALNGSASVFFMNTLLKDPASEDARRYLRKRGIDARMIEMFSIGYAPKGWDGLVRFLRRTQSSLELAVTLGLIQPRKSGQGHFDRFRNRIMFPIFGTTGQILAFGGRALEEDTAKYMNSPESFIFRKGSLLYGLQQAHEAIREKDTAILVEGYVDLITLHQAGFRNSVAVLGTALTVDQIQLLKRYSANFLLLFDGDAAGKAASFRNVSEFLEKRVTARAIYLPQGEDPDSMVRKEGKEAFEQRLAGASPLLDLFIEDKMGNDPARHPVARKVKVLREILPVLSKIPDTLEQQFRIQALAEKVGIDELTLRGELSTSAESRDRHKSQPEGMTSVVAGRWPPEERLLCQVLIQFPNLAPRLLEANVIDAFSDIALKGVVRAIADHYSSKATVDLPEILSLQDDPDVVNLLTGLSCKQEFTEDEALVALRDSVRRMLKKSLQARLKQVNQKIREAEAHRQREVQNSLFMEKQKLLQEEKALHR